MGADEKPFVEIHVVKTQEHKKSRNQLLEIKKRDFESGKGITFSWTGEPSSPILRVEFDTLKNMETTYYQEIPLYELILEYKDELARLFKPILQFKHKHKSKGINHVSHKEIYITTYHRTNYKEILRNYYSFTIPVAQLIGAEVSIEETHDGFIHFIKDKEVFDTISSNKMDFEEVSRWINNLPANLSDPIFATLLEKIKNRIFG